ncbi:hypothetical protein F2981_22080 (plasmid) [Sinorhizobium meliloti]|nr:hypothetical protein [Sinorhizobium meliloti]
MHGSSDYHSQDHPCRQSFGRSPALKGCGSKSAPGRVHTLLGEQRRRQIDLDEDSRRVHGATSGEIVLDGQPYRPSNPQEAASLSGWRSSSGNWRPLQQSDGR